MLSRILSYNDVGDVVIVDNGSTYEPLLEWYETHPCEVVMLPNSKIGNRAPWTHGIVDRYEKYYVITDPDLGIETTPDDTLQYLAEKENALSLGKIGLALDWSSVKLSSPCFDHCQGHEKRRYEHSRVRSNIRIDTVIDTTFALYSQRIFKVGGGCAQPPYSARHYMWELSNEDIAKNNELLYYFKNTNRLFSSKKFFSLT